MLPSMTYFFQKYVLSKQLQRGYEHKGRCCVASRRNFGTLVSALESRGVLSSANVKDCQQITFVTLIRFCLLSKERPTPLVVNEQHQDGRNTKQNQMENRFPFYIVFQVLKVLLIKICKIQPLDLLFLAALY